MKIIGRFISTTIYGRVIEGTVVKMIRAGQKLSKDEMTEYAGIGPTHRCYKSVRGPAKVERLILLRDGGSYWIAPTHLFVK